MEIFEYLSVAVSIVLALGLATLLRVLRDVLEPGRRYWVHTIWVLAVAFLHIQLWWAYWDYSTGVAWSFPKFILLLCAPAVLFLMAASLVSAESGMGWREHFYRERRWFFALMSLYMLVAISTSWLVRDVPLTHPYRIPQAVFLGVSVVGLTSRNHTVHVILASVTITLFFFSQLVFRFLPTPLPAQ